LAFWPQRRFIRMEKRMPAEQFGTAWRDYSAKVRRLNLMPTITQGRNRNSGAVGFFAGRRCNGSLHPVTCYPMQQASPCRG
jgi:hypothetical protein